MYFLSGFGGGACRGGAGKGVVRNITLINHSLDVALPAAHRHVLTLMYDCFTALINDLFACIGLGSCVECNVDKNFYKLAQDCAREVSAFGLRNWKLARQIKSKTKTNLADI